MTPDHAAQAREIVGTVWVNRDFVAAIPLIADALAAAHAAGVAQERERAAGVAADHQAICTDDEQSCQCGFVVADAIRAGA